MYLCKYIWISMFSSHLTAVVAVEADDVRAYIHICILICIYFNICTYAYVHTSHMYKYLYMYIYKYLYMFLHAYLPVDSSFECSCRS